MNVIGRYERVRALGAEGFQGPPYILDRKRAVLLPMRGSEEWWSLPDVVWIRPSQAGSASTG